MNRDFIDNVSRTLGRSTSRRQTFKLVAGGLVGGLVATSGLNKAAAQQGLLIPIEGTLDGDPFSGFLQVTRFFNQGGQLAVAGNILDAAKEVIGTFTALVTPQQATCQILRLELGPINLDLLGLVITTNQIVLEITAEQGPGNLLGNLLCGIAGLLDSGAGVNALVRALNRLLRNLLG